MINLTVRIVTILLFCLTTLCFPVAVYLVDDFEDSNITKNPEWWKFGILKSQILDNNKKEFAYLEEKSLWLTGDPSEWYVGGMGTYLGLDGTPYNAIKLIVRGKGIESGFLRIELYDDDNQNWVADIHPEDQSIVEFDDKFIYSQKVDWSGWRVLIIPFDDFVDDNPQMGDNLFNPSQLGTSGGLLQIQFIVLATNKEVAPDIRIDNIKLFHYVKPKPVEKPQASFDDW